MRYLVDTHLLVWAKTDVARLGTRAAAILSEPENALCFSVASVWEMVIKAARGRPDFAVVPGIVRTALLDSEYDELPVTAAHVLTVADLPPHHGDPFDRLLVAQAKAEGLRLLTADAGLARYGEWVEVVS